jgi:outer membrane protein TolC
MNKNKFFIFIVALYILFIINIYGMSLNDAFKKTSESNAELIKAEKEVEAAAAKRFSAFTNFLPKFSVGGMYTRISEEPPSLDFSGIMTPGFQFPDIAGNPLLQYRFLNNYSAYFRINQPIFSGGMNFALASAAHDEYILKETALKKEKADLKVKVIKAFYGIIVAEEMKKLAEEAIGQLKRHLDRVNNLRKAGSATEYDTLKTEVRLLSWTPRLREAERNLEKAKKNLLLIIGEDPDSEEKITIDGELTYTDVLIPEKIEDLVKNALSKRPEIIMAERTKNIRSNIKIMNISSMLPKVNLQYNYNYLSKRDYIKIDSSDWDIWWDLRIMVNWDFFTFGGNFMKVKEASAIEYSADEDISFLKKSIKIEVEDTILKLKEAKESVDVWKKNMELATKGYEIAEAKYKNNTITNTEFLDSHLDLIEAKVKYFSALYDYKIAEAELKRVIADDSAYDF